MLANPNVIQYSAISLIFTSLIAILTIWERKDKNLVFDRDSYLIRSDIEPLWDLRHLRWQIMIRFSYHNYFNCGNIICRVNDF